jgi:hypothetical protein
MDNDKKTHGIFKIINEEMKQRVIDITRIKREIELLKAKYNYYGLLVTYRASFERADGESTYNMGFMGVNMEKACYVTHDTHEGPELEPEHSKLANKTRNIMLKAEKLSTQRKADNRQLWDDLEEMFNLDENCHWYINSRNMTVELDDNPSGGGLDFLKDLLS